MATRSVHSTHSFEDVAYAVSLLFAVRRIMRTELAAHLLKDETLDPSTWLWIETMKFISERDGPKMKDVAKYLCITPPSTTSLIRDLTKNGFVTTLPDPLDKRTSRLSLTRKGKTELEHAVTRGTKILSGLFTDFSQTELREFVQLLERIKAKETVAAN